jgi:hypothetical protein
MSLAALTPHLRSRRKFARMSLQAILLPVFVEVFLIFGLLFWLGKLRADDVRSGAVQLSQHKFGENVGSDKTRQVQRCFQNQFETPTLFYVVVILTIMAKKADIPFVVLEWLYVLLRLAHAWAYCGRNDLAFRTPLFGAGLLVLLIMWLLFAFQLLTTL